MEDVFPKDVEDGGSDEEAANYVTAESVSSYLSLNTRKREEKFPVRKSEHSR